MGIEQSRRDDLEGLGFVLVYFLRGSLPWQGLIAKDKNEKYEKIKNKKSTISVDELCKGFPEEFKQYMKYCRSLGFKDKPDYKMLKNLFLKIMERENIENNGIFDWNIKKIKSQDESKLKENKGKVIISNGISGIISISRHIAG